MPTNFTKQQHHHNSKKTKKGYQLNRRWLLWRLKEKPKELHFYNWLSITISKKNAKFRLINRRGHCLPEFSSIWLLSQGKLLLRISYSASSKIKQQFHLIKLSRISVEKARSKSSIIFALIFTYSSTFSYFILVYHLATH